MSNISDERLRSLIAEGIHSGEMSAEDAFAKLREEAQRLATENSGQQDGQNCPSY